VVADEMTEVVVVTEAAVAEEAVAADTETAEVVADETTAEEAEETDPGLDLDPDLDPEVEAETEDDLDPDQDHAPQAREVTDADHEADQPQSDETPAPSQRVQCVKIIEKNEKKEEVARVPEKILAKILPLVLDPDESSKQRKLNEKLEEHFP